MLILMLAIALLLIVVFYKLNAARKKRRFAREELEIRLDLEEGNRIAAPLMWRQWTEADLVSEGMIDPERERFVGVEVDSDGGYSLVIAPVGSDEE